MGSRIRVSEAADYAFLVVHQPTDTLLRCMAIYKLAVLVCRGAELVYKFDAWRMKYPSRLELGQLITSSAPRPSP